MPMKTVHYKPKPQAAGGKPDSRRVAELLRGLPLPSRLGRAPETTGHVMRRSPYLDRVWEAYRHATDEKDVFLSFLHACVLDGLSAPRGLSVLDVGPDDGSLVRRLEVPIRRVTMIEPDPVSCARLADALGEPGPGRPDSRLVRACFPCGDLGGETFDLVLLSHVLYYIDRALWPETVACALRHTRPGGRVVVAYVCDESDLYDTLRAFGGHALGLADFETDCAAHFADRAPTAYRMDSAIEAADETDFLHLLGFLMADRTAHAAPDDLRAHVRRYARADGSYRAAKRDGALVLTA